MRFYFVDIDQGMTDSWNKDFEDYKNIEIVNNDYAIFIEEKKTVDAIVISGNSYGIMDGALDSVYLDYFGNEIQDNVQKYIAEHYGGEQPVGSAFSIVATGPHGICKKVIHIPCMRIPQPLIDPRVIYTCTRSALVEAGRLGAQNVLIPAFGHCTGRVKSSEVSLMQKHAVDNFNLFYKSKQPVNWERVKQLQPIDDILINHFFYS